MNIMFFNRNINNQFEAKNSYCITKIAVEQFVFIDKIYIISFRLSNIT
jgi:hypothetical protein